MIAGGHDYEQEIPTAAKAAVVQGVSLLQQQSKRGRRQCITSIEVSMAHIDDSKHTVGLYLAYE